MADKLQIYGAEADSLKSLVKILRKDLGELDSSKILAISHAAGRPTVDGHDFSAIVFYLGDPK